MKIKSDKPNEKYNSHQEFNKRSYRLEKEPKESFSCACLRFSAERRMV